MEHIQAEITENAAPLQARHIAVVAASFVMVFFNTSAQFAFGVMFKPVISEFGWSRSAVSSIFFLHMVVFAVGVTVVGKLYDRFGPKWIIIVSTLFVSAGFALTSIAHSIGQFFFSYGLLVAMGFAGTGVPLASTIVSKWFEKSRGLAISIAITGSSVGSFVMVPVLSAFSVAHGWRASYFSLGAVTLVVNMLLVLFAINGDPRHLGVRPFGAQRAKRTEPGPVGRPSRVERAPDFGLSQALAARSFLLLLVALFVNGCGNYLTMTHFINFATDCGVSSLTAGRMMGWYGLLGLAGVLVAGPAADRIGCRAPLALTFALRFVLYLVILKYQSVPSMYAFVLLFGFTQLVAAPLTPMLIGKLYGFDKIGLLTGFVNTVYFFGAGLFAYVAGLIFDKTGSYETTFFVSAVMAAVAALCSLLIGEKKRGEAAPVHPASPSPL